MYYFRVWVGSILFALGVAGLIWWARNLFRDGTMQAMGFSKHPFLSLIIVVILVIIGLWIYSGFPLIGWVVGILLGLYLSRKSR